MSKKKKRGQLLVEGKNDQHVVWALCQQHKVPKTFTVEIPGDVDGGIEELLAGIPLRLKSSNLAALGIVVDADQNLQGRWQSISDRLSKAGYGTYLPKQPDPNGTIISAPSKPPIGIWLMPDNQSSGMVEDFVARLIPDHDLLAPKAEAILQDIEQEKLNLYIAQPFGKLRAPHHSKALIHTWLAWQKIPGRPMGQSITAHALQYDKALANTFVAWLKRLFSKEN